MREPIGPIDRRANENANYMQKILSANKIDEVPSGIHFARPSFSSIYVSETCLMFRCGAYCAV